MSSINTGNVHAVLIISLFIHVIFPWNSHLHTHTAGMKYVFKIITYSSLVLGVNENNETFFKSYIFFFLSIFRNKTNDVHLLLYELLSIIYKLILR